MLFVSEAWNLNVKQFASRWGCHLQGSCPICRLAGMNLIILQEVNVTLILSLIYSATNPVKQL